MSDDRREHNILKPCPFCSNVEKVEIAPDYNYVGCGACGARGPLERTWKLAVEKWNGVMVSELSHMIMKRLMENNE